MNRKGYDMQINDQALMSIVDLSKESKEVSEELNSNLGCELDFFFNNVMDTVVEFFELEKA